MPPPITLSHAQRKMRVAPATHRPKIMLPSRRYCQHAAAASCLPRAARRHALRAAAAVATRAEASQTGSRKSVFAACFIAATPASATPPQRFTPITPTPPPCRACRRRRCRRRCRRRADMIYRAARRAFAPQCRAPSRTRAAGYITLATYMRTSCATG